MTERTPGGLVTVALVAVGGAAGANGRHLLAVLVPGLGGTLVANVLGCGLLGALTAGPRIAARLGPRGRLLLATGFVASFTTYSTFAVETATAAPTLAVGNVLANYAIGAVAVLAGRTVARRSLEAAGTEGRH